MFRPLASLLLSCLLLAACAHQPDTRSARHKQALELASLGEKAYYKGELDLARDYYGEALRLNTSIENARGIAANTLSLAQLDLKRADHVAARQRLQSLLDDRHRLFADTDRAEAAARLAQIALLQNQAEHAAQLAQQAQALCKEGCVAAAAISSLQASAALAQGNAVQAEAWAHRAASIAEKAGQPVEQANARRLLGGILLGRGAALEAVPLFEQALEQDKQLGLPERIAEDLHGLAEARDALGQKEAAASLREREAAVRAAQGMR